MVRARIVLILMLLVILPTAILCLLAAHALRNWELVLRAQQERSAGSAVEEVADRLHEVLMQDLGRVRTEVGGRVAKGADFAGIRKSADELCRGASVIRQVYIYVKPYGFVLPESADKEAGLNVEERERRARHLQRIAEALGRAVDTVAPRVDPVRFVADDGSFLFTTVPTTTNVFVGYEVQPDRFVGQLSRTLADLSGGGFHLFAEGPGLVVAPPREPAPGQVVVSDTFTAGQESSAGGDAGVALSGRGQELLAQGRLYKPFDYIKIHAEEPGAAGLRQFWRLHARLYAWGAVLLGCAILVGMWTLLRVAADEVRRAQSRSDFVIGVSHDLRTPLASMKVLAETLQMDRVADPARRREFLSTIVRESDRLGQLIERVLYLMRYGQQALVYRMAPVDVAAVLSKTVEVFLQTVARTTAATPGESRGIALVVGEELPRVEADEGAVQQVVMNLLDNAWKYSSAATRAAVAPIHVRAFSAAAVFRRRRFGRIRSWVAIEVRDAGTGMTRPELRRIFREFYRAPSAVKSNLSGLGLGLAVCRHVMTAHGGWIDVESELGKGSCFTVYLPADRRTLKDG